MKNPKSEYRNPKHPPSLKLRGIVVRSLGEGEQILNSNAPDSKPTLFGKLGFKSLGFVSNFVLRA
jgi:hypothetical protein